MARMAMKENPAMRSSKLLAVAKLGAKTQKNASTARKNRTTAMNAD